VVLITTGLKFTGTAPTLNHYKIKKDIKNVTRCRKKQGNKVGMIA